jgi:hypothetical protein
MEHPGVLVAAWRIGNSFDQFKHERSLRHVRA